MTGRGIWLLAICALEAFAVAQSQQRYPASWWAPIHDDHKPAWEILPQAAKTGEVILSKRNELGILSNFAATPFTLRGKRYASVEGFWQMMLYPESAPDPRFADRNISWRYTREQVAQMSSFQAKEAGTLAEKNMQKLGIDWVTFESKQMPYRSETKGEHYRLIRQAMLAKLNQNIKVRETLLATGDLILRPDHVQETNAPPEWNYCQIWMEIRDELQKPAMSASFDFADKPDFVVAGVKEVPYVGGHGSEAGARAIESLSRATTSLKNAPSTKAGSPAQTETSLRSALAQHSEDAGLHHSLAGVEEQLGKPLDAVREYERAAKIEPSEINLFDWGTELLVHDAAQPASEVFGKGSALYPRSARMLLGAAVASYMRGEYEPAARAFFAAIDVNPSDPRPYLFLANAQAPEITGKSEYVQRLARFVQVAPDNAWANYLYAMTLWDSKHGAAEGPASARAEAALEKAVSLAPNLAPAWLQRGNLYAERQDFAAAAQAYERAIRADPTLEQAHYRLAATYRKLGESEKARSEAELLDRLAKSSAQERERERSSLQRFIVELRNQ